jgi:hypothetical protein
MTNPTEPTAWYRVPVMWIVVGLPLLSLIGGATMVVLTVIRPDVEIHSERLDATNTTTTTASQR